MATFDQAIPYVLDNEGGYTVDNGGPTNFGIVLPILQEAGIDVDGDGDIDVDDIKKMTVEQAKQAYWLVWWNKWGYSKIENQKIATKILDCAVNFGPRQGHIIAQRACRSAYTRLVEDGVLGPKSIAAINVSNAQLLLAAMKSEQAGVYRMILQKQPQLEIYRDGWLNRAYRSL